MGSCILVNLICAQPSRSRQTSRNCKGSSSRGDGGSKRCRTTVRTTTRTTTKTTTTSPSNKFRLPSIKTTRSSSRPSFHLPPRKGPTLSSVSPTKEENDSVSSSKKIKTSAKKYFQKVKSRLQTAAIWYVDNKDKTIEQIMGERWKQKGKCSGADSKEKRKSCVSAALADSEEDTPEAKQLKEVLKSLLEEDSEEVYEFLSTSSSRTFHDIENEEEIQDKSTSEYSDTNNLKGKIQLPTRGTRKTTRSSSRPSFQLPTRKGPTLSSVSPTKEENDSVSSSKKIKTSAKKYFQKVKSRLQTAAIWYVDNKDKTIEQIMGERWKQKGKCSGADSKEKRKSCVSAALADSEEDTPEAKQLKEVLKS